MNLKLETARVEERDISQIHSVLPSKVKFKRFFTSQQKSKKITMTPTPQYLILATVLVVSIWRVTVSLETKNGRIGHRNICCKSKKWRKNKKFINQVNTLGKVDKRKEKISKSSNETLLKSKFVFVTINNIKIKLQLETRSDIVIINEKTWKKTE